MANCKNCLFYNTKFDELRNQTNDIIIENEKKEDHHYCIAHENNIDDYFARGGKCKYEVTA